jgi:hypothetical protein
MVEVGARAIHAFGTRNPRSARMQLKNAIGFVGIAMGVMVGVSSLAGCASGAEATRSQARGEADSFRQSLSEMPGHIDKTIASLMTLSDNRAADKSKELKTFKNELATMDRDAREIGKQADRATSDADAYFSAWARETARTADPQKRQEMERTMTSRRANYETAQSYLNSARRRYLDLTENLHDIARMYERSGTDSTQPAVRDAIDQSVQDSVYVKNYVARLSEQIDTVLGIK